MNSGKKKVEALVSPRQSRRIQVKKEEGKLPSYAALVNYAETRVEEIKKILPTPKAKKPRKNGDVSNGPTPKQRKLLTITPKSPVISESKIFGHASVTLHKEVKLQQVKEVCLRLGVECTLNEEGENNIRGSWEAVTAVYNTLRNQSSSEGKSTQTTLTLPSSYHGGRPIHPLPQEEDNQEEISQSNPSDSNKSVLSAVAMETEDQQTEESCSEDKSELMPAESSSSEKKKSSSNPSLILDVEPKKRYRGKLKKINVETVDLDKKEEGEEDAQSDENYKPKSQPMKHGHMLSLTNPSRANCVCKICGYRSTRSGINNHKRRYHSKSMYVCPHCNKIYGAPSELALHMTAHDKKLATGEVIPKGPGFKMLSEEGPIFQCLKCKAEIEGVVPLKEHMLQHKKEDKEKNELSCDLCDYVSKGNRYLLTRHMNRCHGTLYFPCAHCSKAYKTETDLANHIQVKHKGLTHCCQECGKVFETHRYLRSHIMRMHQGEKGRRYACAQCHKSFYERNQYHRHMETHKEAPERTTYICEVCGKRFLTKNYLKLHADVHTGTKPHKCQLCPMSFTLLTTLQKHQFVHAKEKPHACEVCSKRFISKSRLRSHMVTHTGISQYKCEECGKSYTRPDVLRHHRCCKPVTRKADAEVPVETEKSSEMYMCSWCSKLFVSLEEINIHIAEHTTEETDITNVDLEPSNDLTTYVLTDPKTGDNTFVLPSGETIEVAPSGVPLLNLAEVIEGNEETMAVIGAQQDELEPTE